MNSAVVGVCGLLFLAMGLGGLVASYVSERRRLVMEAMGMHRWQAVLGSVPSALLAAGGFSSTPWHLWLGVVAFVAYGLYARQHLRRIDDPPAYIARMRDRSMNPLVQLRHPIREGKATLVSMDVRRNRREQREWEDRHGIPRRGEG